MSGEKLDQLYKLLEEFRDENIQQIAEANDLSERKVRKMLANEPEDVYNLDDEGLLQGIDAVMSAIYW